jgi:hypothetical protein
MQLSKFLTLAMTIACAGLMTPRRAFPIGRTGNGAIGDMVEGYSAQVPEDFNEISIADKGAVILGSNYLFDPEFGQTEFIQARPFTEAYPHLVNGSSTSVLAYFETIPGNYAVIQTQNCGLSLLGEGVNNWVGISTWGNGNGYVLLSAAKTDEAKQGILTMLQNTEITTSCWK